MLAFDGGEVHQTEHSTAPGTGSHVPACSCLRTCRSARTSWRILHLAQQGEHDPRQLARGAMLHLWQRTPVGPLPPRCVPGSLSPRTMQ
jgi:hypothetical protein